MSPAYTFNTSKIVGNPTEDCWSQIHTFTPDEPEKKEKRGSLFVVLVITGVPFGIESIALGREVLGRFHEEYFGNLEGSAFERIKEAVNKIENEYQGIEITAGSVLDNVLYLAVLGEGKVFLKRGNEIGILLEGEETIKLASGYLLENDFIFFGSRRFFSSVGKGMLKAVMETNFPLEAEEIITPVILGKEDMADCAGLFVLVNKEKEMFSYTSSKEEVKEDYLKEEINFSKDNKKENIFEKIFTQRRISIRNSENEKKKKIYFIISIFLSLILILSAVFGINKNALHNKEEKFNKAVTPIVEQIEKGKNIFFISEDEARKMFEDAKKTLSEKEKLFKNKKQEIENIKNEIDKFISESGKDKNEVGADLLMDLNLMENTKGDLFLSDSDYLIILDKNAQKLVRFNVVKKSYDFVGLKSGNYNFLTGKEGKYFVVGNEGVDQISFENKKVRKVIAKDEIWGEIGAVGYYNNSLYSIDKTNSKIFKYSSSGDIFSSKKIWNNTEESGLSESLSLGIDGNIWILTNKEILKFNQGNKEQFSLPTEIPQTVSFNKIVVSEDSEEIYLLDKASGRIYLINKKGESVKIYYSEKIKESNDFTVNKKKAKLYLLTNDRIFEIGL